MKNEIVPLKPAEKSRLADLKQTITAGINTFIEVGSALAEIMNSRLYLDTHETFESFCAANWDMGKAYAYRLIAASEVIENVAHGRQIPEVSERALRPLAKLTPAKQRKAWAKLDKSKSITVTAVVQAVAKVSPEPAHQVLADPLDDPVVAFKTKALVKWKRWFDGSTSPLSSMPCPTHKAYDAFVTALLK